MTALPLRRYRRLLDLRCSRTARVRAAAWRAVRSGCRRATEAALFLLALAVVVGLALSDLLTLPLMFAFGGVAWAVSRERELWATRRERDAAVDGRDAAEAALRREHAKVAGLVRIAAAQHELADAFRRNNARIASLADRREGAAR